MDAQGRNEGDFPRDHGEREIAALFREAESAIKTAEELHSQLPFPAVNELRYAGRHLAEWLAGRDAEEFRKAVGHCRRALYDAHEARLLFYLEELAKFRDDYRNIVVSEVVKSYGEIADEIGRARDDINRMRASGMDKAEVYRKMAEYADLLARRHSFLEAQREELNKKIRQERRLTFASWAAMFGAAIAFITLVLTMAR